MVIEFIEVENNFVNLWNFLWLFELGFELMGDVFKEVMIYKCLLRIVKDIRSLVMLDLMVARKFGS